jgi:hypothetical protein
LALVFAVVAAAVAFFVGNAQTTAKFNTVDRNLTLWNIQPGLGTVMIEYGIRFDNVWYAADAANWDMVLYQLNEMIEIQEVGETTRPARADALKEFEDGYLAPLLEAAGTQDQDAFVSAYDNAITGCNRCHGEQTNSEATPFAFIRIQRPTAPVLTDVDWGGRGQ